MFYDSVDYLIVLVEWIVCLGLVGVSEVGEEGGVVVFVVFVVLFE